MEVREIIISTSNWPVQGAAVDTPQHRVAGCEFCTGQHVLMSIYIVFCNT